MSKEMKVGGMPVVHRGAYEAALYEINILKKVVEEQRARIERLNSIIVQAEFYRYMSNTYGQPDHRTAMAGRQLDEALAEKDDD